MIDHLIRVHGFNRQGVERIPIIIASNESIPSVSLIANPLPIQLPFNPDVFKDLLLRWIIMNQVAFSQAVSPFLRSIFSYLCAVQASFTDLTNAMPTSSSTISTWIMDCFSENKIKIQHHLKQKAISSIHLSFDLWTSTNHLALLGIVAFWVDTSGCIQHALLGLPRLLGAHTGENQGQHLWEVITDYGIQHSLGYFCLDNASNNQTALRYIAGEYKAHTRNGIELNVHQRYVRCYGHILNLVVKVFLYGKKSAYLAGNMDEKRTIEKENQELDRWRKVGPLGRLRNIIVWIRGSPQRREAFNKVVHTIFGSSTTARELILGNVTRWTGDHDALKRAVLFKEAIDFHIQRIIHDEPSTSLINDQLSSQDWLFLEHVLEFLTPFRDETLLLEGNRKQGALHDVYPSLEVIRNHILLFLSRFPDSDSHFHQSLELALDKLNKYYSLSTLSPIICASIVLNPNMDGFFESQEYGWGNRSDWVEEAMRLVRQLWQQNYMPLQLQPPTVPFPSPQKSSSTSSGRSFKKVRLMETGTDGPDELERYLRWLIKNDSEPPIVQLVNWWSMAGSLYPKLSRMALDALSVPAMSAECERVFSRLVTYYFSLLFFKFHSHKYDRNTRQICIFILT
jgi:hypothetical protein